MTSVVSALSAFLDRADVAGWSGLPDVRARDLGVDPDARVEHDPAGDPPQDRAWVAVPSEVYRGGLRCWIDADGRALVLEGIRPRTDDGEPLHAPDLGEPSVRLDAMLGSLVLDGGEFVYPERGIAVRLNPDNGVLLSLIGFAPTTAARYAASLRPALLRSRPLRSEAHSGEAGAA